MRNLVKCVLILFLLCMMSSCNRGLRGLPPENNSSGSEEKKTKKKVKLPDPEKMPMNMSL